MTKATISTTVITSSITSSENNKCCIGEGTYGRVYSMDGFPKVALKVNNELQYGVKEAKFLQLIDHHHDDSDNNNDDGSSMTTIPSSSSCRLYLKDEWVDGKVVLHLRRFQFSLSNLCTPIYIDELIQHRNELIFKLVDNYNCLYQKFIIHGDIKNSNILVDCRSLMMPSLTENDAVADDAIVKTSSTSNDHHSPSFFDHVSFCDFSISLRQFGRALPGEFTSYNLMYIQSLDLRAPELVLGECCFDYKIDLWSIGIIILRTNGIITPFHGCRNIKNYITALCKFFGRKEVENYCNRKKDSGSNNNNNVTTIVLPKVNYRSQRQKIINQLKGPNQAELRQLVFQLLTLDPNERIGMKELYQKASSLAKRPTTLFKERDLTKTLDQYFASHPLLATTNPDHSSSPPRAFKEGNREELLTRILKDFFLAKNISPFIFSRALFLFDYCCDHGLLLMSMTTSTMTAPAATTTTNPSVALLVAIINICGYTIFPSHTDFYELHRLSLMSQPGIDMVNLYVKLKDHLEEPAPLDYLRLLLVDPVALTSTTTNNDWIHQFQWEKYIKLLCTNRQDWKQMLIESFPSSLLSASSSLTTNKGG